MDRGAGVRCWLSAGNEEDLELSDFIEHLIGDPKISNRGFSTARGFLSAAHRAGVAGKPIVAMVPGRQKAVLSPRRATPPTWELGARWSACFSTTE